MRSNDIQDFIRRLKSNPKVASFDEAATRQAIVLPLLQLLGWDTTNIDEVTPEYSVHGRRVDLALQTNHRSSYFIELKKAGIDLSDRDEEQLLEYSFRQGVDLALLTNGITWLFYLPTEKGDWTERKFYAIDITRQNLIDATEKFIDFLSKEKVASGEAIQNARAIHRGKTKRRAIKKALPEAWNTIITEPDSLLVELIAEVTERICGYRPDDDDVKAFIIRTSTIQPRPTPDEDIKTPKRKRRTSVVRGSQSPITQTELKPIILEVLRHLGGRATKQAVHDEIYRRYSDTFNTQYYQDRVESGHVRWVHFIDWARNKLREEGKIKPPEESGRGIWELV